MARRDRLAGAVLGSAGMLAILYYMSWWLEDQRYRSPWWLLVLAAALAYIVLQMVSTWIVNLVAQRAAPASTAHPDLRVDVFITAYHEPVDLVEYALAAALAMRGPARVWLLDDGDDAELAALAERLGCGYLTRSGQRDAKAGNINAALEKTTGDVVVIFDIDHAPHPDFLAKSLGHFNDPKMGFVQVMLTFRNFEESWVARSATESSLEFYNPTYLGAQQLGAASLMGSNALIRRAALLSIGGYQPGLAEDLATSIALHSAGWHSAYVAEPLAPGLSPSSLSAWSVQQLKWARGVFELLLTALPQELGRLTWGQRISYAARMTKYWIGPTVFVHLAATILILIWGDIATRAAFHSYLWHLAPLVAIDMGIRGYTLSRHRHADVPNSSLLGAVVLVYASWPVYLLAWTLAILRLPLRFQPTPKDKVQHLNAVWLLPQFTALALLLWGLYLTIFVYHHAVSLVLVASIAQALLQFLLLVRWVQEDEARGAGIRRRLRKSGSTTYANRNS